MAEMRTWIITNSWGTELGRIDLPIEYQDAIEELLQLSYRAGYSDGTYDESVAHETW